MAASETPCIAAGGQQQYMGQAVATRREEEEEGCTEVIKVGMYTGARCWLLVGSLV
jgi:hypothetical protein